MSYTPNVWANGDVVTSEKLNAMEQGIAAASGGGGGGGALVVYKDADTGALDKTWQEIHDAVVSTGAVYANHNGSVTLFIFAGENGLGQYHVDTALGDEFYTNSADGYPALGGEQ